MNNISDKMKNRIWAKFDKILLRSISDKADGNITNQTRDIIMNPIYEQTTNKIYEIVNFKRKK